MLGLELSLSPQRLFPSGFLETGDDGVGSDQQGALYEHAVGGEQGVLLVFGHLGQLLRQLHLAVEHAARVEEALEGQPAPLVPCTQFVGGGIVFHDVPVGVGHAVCVQPLLSLLAGGALRVFQEQNIGGHDALAFSRAARGPHSLYFA